MGARAAVTSKRQQAGSNRLKWEAARYVEGGGQ